MKPARTKQSDRSEINASIYNPEFLRQQARWIRDDLDPQVARDGPEALHSGDLLNIDDFLRRLVAAKIQLDDLRFSRLHLAVTAICGKATRWPAKLIERADALEMAWKKEYGPLKNITAPLYEAGGRLKGICKPDDLSKEKLIIKWLKSPGVKISPLLARRVGNLGFKPGESVPFFTVALVGLADNMISWWISPLFAFKDGIIDSAESSGGIVADVEGAYAVLMTSDEEINAPSPDVITYRARNQDRGRYRLTAATRESRQPVRILRAHGLRSLWAPKAGVRYEGLYVVTGWSIRPRPKEIVYDIHFRRLASELSIDIVLCRPYSDEIEDYREYKRTRQAARSAQEQAAKAKREAATPTFTISSDGVFDELKIGPSTTERLKPCECCE